jgi:hypothetical protein
MGLFRYRPAYYSFYLLLYVSRTVVPSQKKKSLDHYNKLDPEMLHPGERNKNDLSQLQEKFMDVSPRDRDANGNGNLQNGLLQYAANEIAKGNGKSVFNTLTAADMPGVFS